MDAIVPAESKLSILTSNGPGMALDRMAGLEIMIAAQTMATSWQATRIWVVEDSDGRACTFDVAENTFTPFLTLKVAASSKHFA